MKRLMTRGSLRSPPFFEPAVGAGGVRGRAVVVAAVRLGRRLPVLALVVPEPGSLQFCVATIIQSPVCPTELPPACDDAAPRVARRVRPYGAGMSRIRTRVPLRGIPCVAVFHQSPFMNGLVPNHGLQPPSKSRNSFPLPTAGSQATSWLPWEDSVRSVVKIPGRSTERMPTEGKTVTSLPPSATLSNGELGSPEANGSPSCGPDRSRPPCPACRCTPAGRSPRHCPRDTTSDRRLEESRTPSP